MAELNPAEARLLLGLDAGPLTEAGLRNARNAALRAHHPDLAGGDETDMRRATYWSGQINAAYEVLKHELRGPDDSTAAASGPDPSRQSFAGSAARAAARAAAEEQAAKARQAAERAAEEQAAKARESAERAAAEVRAARAREAEAREAAERAEKELAERERAAAELAAAARESEHSERSARDEAPPAMPAPPAAAPAGSASADDQTAYQRKFAAVVAVALVLAIGGGILLNQPRAATQDPNPVAVTTAAPTPPPPTPAPTGEPALAWYTSWKQTYLSYVEPCYRGTPCDMDTSLAYTDGSPYVVSLEVQRVAEAFRDNEGMRVGDQTLCPAQVAMGFELMLSMASEVELLRALHLDDQHPVLTKPTLRVSYQPCDQLRLRDRATVEGRLGDAASVIVAAKKAIAKRDWTAVRKAADQLTDVGLDVAGLGSMESPPGVATAWRPLRQLGWDLVRIGARLSVERLAIAKDTTALIDDCASRIPAILGTK